jgi:DivIVA domain-containing protein
MKILNKTEIVEKEFKIKEKGYDVTEVDTFLDLVVSFASELENTNSLMRDQLNDQGMEMVELKKKLESKQSQIADLNSRMEKNISSTSEFEFNSDRRAVDALSRLTRMEKLLQQLIDKH